MTLGIHLCSVCNRRTTNALNDDEGSESCTLLRLMSAFGATHSISVHTRNEDDDEEESTVSSGYTRFE